MDWALLRGPGLDWAGQAIWNNVGLHWSGLDLATLGSGHVQSHPAGLSPLDAGPMFGSPVVVWGSRTRMEGQGLRATSRSGLCPQHPLEEGRVPWSCRASAGQAGPSANPHPGPAQGLLGEGPSVPAQVGVFSIALGPGDPALGVLALGLPLVTWGLSAGDSQASQGICQETRPPS